MGFQSHGYWNHAIRAGATSSLVGPTAGHRDWEQGTERATYCLLVLHAASESPREAMSFPRVSQAVRSTSKQQAAPFPGMGESLGGPTDEVAITGARA